MAKVKTKGKQSKKTKTNNKINTRNTNQVNSELGVGGKDIDFKYIEMANKNLSLGNTLVDNLVGIVDNKARELCAESEAKVELNKLRSLEGAGISINVGRVRDSHNNTSLVIDCIYTYGYYRDLVETSLFKKYNGERINKNSRASAELRGNAKTLLGVFYDTLCDRSENYRYTREMVTQGDSVIYHITHTIDLSDTKLLAEIYKKMG